MSKIKKKKKTKEENEEQTFSASGSENNFHKYGAPASRHSPFNTHLKWRDKAMEDFQTSRLTSQWSLLMNWQEKPLPYLGHKGGTVWQHVHNIKG